MSDGSWEPYEDEDPYDIGSDEDVEHCPVCGTALEDKYSCVKCPKCWHTECY